MYLYLGSRNFILWNAHRKRLSPTGLNPVRSPPDASAGRKFVEDEYLLRHNDECEADMICLDEPDDALWDCLRQFIVGERGW